MAKIMIIDDDVDFAANIYEILREEGHDIRALDTTADALPVLMAEKPDILVLDVMFPDNSTAGFDLARQIRREAEIKALPIVLLTGVNQEFPMDFSGDDIDPDWLPVQAFVEKPVDPSFLVKQIRSML